MSPTLQPKCLIFDLETVPAHEGKTERIIKIGALRPDTGEHFETVTDKQLGAGLARLEQMAGRGPGNY